MKSVRALFKDIFPVTCERRKTMLRVCWHPSNEESIRLPWWFNGKESACQCKQETWVQSLIWGDPICREGTMLMPNYWPCAPEPRSHNYWVHVLQLPKPKSPRAHALQQEKPPQWTAGTEQLESSPSLRQLEKSLCSNEDSAQPKINKLKNYKKEEKSIHKLV